ncbi:MAG: hypothetical protein QG617_944 [Campylobacterota bacterium]|nr:hypothetical protein [Campylobacterota bacterium]
MYEELLYHIVVLGFTALGLGIITLAVLKVKKLLKERTL